MTEGPRADARALGSHEDPRGVRNVPFVDLTAAHRALEAELVAATRRVLLSGRFVLGPETSALEAALAARAGVEHAVGVSSGTDALLAALMAFGVGPGDRVITSAYSFVATATAILRLGAIPVLIDIDPASFNIDPDAVGQWLDDHPAEAATVRVLIPVHLFGQCADVDRLRTHTGPRGVAVVEDAAQALGASLPDGSSAPRPRCAGALGAAAALSFYPTKNLGAAGEAGAVLTGDVKADARLRAIRNQGFDGLGRARQLGGNFRLDEVQAAVLNVKLARIDAWTARRRALAARYDAALASAPAIRPPRPVWGPQHHVYHQYVVRIRDRDRLHRALATAGIATRIYYPRPLHHEPSLRGLGLAVDAYPEARRAAAESLALPIHPYLTDAEQDRVIDALLAEVGA